MAGYKAKSIKAILSKKIGAWIDTIEDTDLQEKLKKSVIVTGGAIVSMLQGEEVNDFDIYIRNHDVTVQLAEYYVGRFKSRKQKGIEVQLSVTDVDGRVKINAKSAGVAGIEGTEKPYQYFEGRADEEGEEYVRSLMDNPEVVITQVNPTEIEDEYVETEQKTLKTEKKNKAYRPVFLTSNAITLSDKIQIVLRFYGEPDEIHDNYDFVHCTSYWTNWDNKLVLRPEALEAILSKELKYVGSKYPICSIVRLRKFIKRGWQINAGQIVKMAMQISELDLTRVDVLEDQLTGVDTAYFVQLIERLKEKDPEKVNTAYLIEIIDRLF
jgi:hypothetical protein